MINKLDLCPKLNRTMFMKIIEQLVRDPKKLFLIDGLGAVLSACLLGIVLVKFESVFGIPKAVLYFLAAIPIFFALYDLFSYQKESHRLGHYLKGIAIMNLAYCVLSIGLSLYHKEVIKFWGWYYIVSEVAIILLLVSIELKVSRKLEENSQ